jgi:hypothetical protein
MEKKNLWIITLIAIITIGFIGCTVNATEDNRFTVTFDLDGGNISGDTASVKITVKSGGNITNLPNPQKTENSTGFGGWFTQKDGFGNKFTATTKISSNLTVYAKWINPFIGKWVRDNYEWECYADLTWLILDNNDNMYKGTYSFTETEYTALYTHHWENSSWIDFVMAYSDEYVIDNDQMTFGGGIWIKQN